MFIWNIRICTIFYINHSRYLCIISIVNFASCKLIGGCPKIYPNAGTRRGYSPQPRIFTRPLELIREVSQAPKPPENQLQAAKANIGWNLNKSLISILPQVQKKRIIYRPSSSNSLIIDKLKRLNHSRRNLCKLCSAWWEN